MRTILLATLLVFSAGLGACKKKEETKAADPVAVEKKGDDTKAADTKPADTKPAEGTPSEQKIVNANDYETKAIDMTNKLLALFVDAGKDCDKLATNLSKFGDDNRALFESLKAFETSNPDAEKAFDEKMKGREKEFEDKLGPAFDACKNHEGMKTAMAKLPMD